MARDKSVMTLDNRYYQLISSYCSLRKKDSENYVFLSVGITKDRNIGIQIGAITLTWKIRGDENSQEIIQKIEGLTEGFYDAECMTIDE